MVSKCKHDVYLSPSDQDSGLAWGCQQCYPNGHPEVKIEPILPRSSCAVIMQGMVTLTNCTSCGNVRTYYSPTCRVCGMTFPEAELRGREGTSNRKQIGVCPDCASTVHYEVPGKKLWECCDCGKKFRAPKVDETESEGDDA